MCELSFRLVNLQAAMYGHNQGLENELDPHVVRATALEIDRDLENWELGAPKSWRHTTVADIAADLFHGRKYIDPNLWAAQAWNNFCALRILAHQIILQATSLIER